MQAQQTQAANSAAEADLAVLRHQHDDLVAQYRQVASRCAALEANSSDEKKNERERDLEIRAANHEAEVDRLTVEAERLGAELDDLQTVKKQ